MPYLSDSYNPPPLPPLGALQTFADLRTHMGNIETYLQQVRSAEITYFQHIAENTNQNSATEGATIASASTITITSFMHRVTGTATISTIRAPAGFTGQVMLISVDGFIVDDSGNILIMLPPNFISPNGHVVLTWLPSQQKFIADTCRLYGGGGVPGGAGALVNPALEGVGINIAPSSFVISNTGVISLHNGGGINVSAATGDITVSNTGVLSCSQGAGIIVSNATGNVNITNSGVRQVFAGSGVTLTGTVNNPVISASAFGGGSVVGTTDEIGVVTVGTTATVSLAGPHAYATATNHGVLVGSGTAPVTPLAVGATGEVLTGNSGADPSFATIDTTFLSDVTTGTYTPNISGSGTAGTYTYVHHNGYWMAIGPFMMVMFDIQWSAVAGGPTGNVQIDLPTPGVATLTNGNWGGALSTSTGVTYTNANFTYLALQAASGAAVVNIWQNGSATAAAILPTSALGGTGRLIGQLTFRTA